MIQNDDLSATTITHNQFEITRLNSTLEQCIKGGLDLYDQNFQLRAEIEELRDTNDGLRDMNEELRNTNEELRNANEILRTGNEKLRHANKAFRHTNKELRNTNIGLRNTNIGLCEANERLETEARVSEDTCKMYAFIANESQKT